MSIPRARTRLTKRGDEVYDCGLQGCPGTLGKPHPQAQCPGRILGTVRDQLKERLDDGSGPRREVRVFCSNNGTWIAEFKIGTVKFQQPVGGKDAHDAISRAKRWLSTPIYKAAK